MGVVQSDKIRGVAGWRCILVGKVIQYYFAWAKFRLSSLSAIFMKVWYIVSGLPGHWICQPRWHPIDHYTESGNPISTSIKLSKAVMWEWTAVLHGEGSYVYSTMASHMYTTWRNIHSWVIAWLLLKVLHVWNRQVCLLKYCHHKLFIFNQSYARNM